MTKLNLDELIKDIEAQVQQLRGKHEMLVRLRDLGAKIDVPDAPEPPDAQGQAALAQPEQPAPEQPADAAA